MTFKTFMKSSVLAIGFIIFVITTLNSCKTKKVYVDVPVPNPIESIWNGTCGSTGQPGDAVSASWNTTVTNQTSRIVNGSCGALGDGCALNLAYSSFQGTGNIILQGYDTLSDCTNGSSTFLSVFTVFPLASTPQTLANDPSFCSTQNSYFTYVFQPLGPAPDNTQIITLFSESNNSTLSYCSLQIAVLGVLPTTSNNCIPC